MKFDASSLTGRALARLLAATLSFAACAAIADNGERDRDRDRDRDRECPDGRDVTYINGRIHTMERRTASSRR